MRKLRYLVYGLLCLGFGTLTQAQDIPVRGTGSVAGMKEMIADCAINSRLDQEYEAKLRAQILDLQKQIADLQAVQSNP